MFHWDSLEIWNLSAGHFGTWHVLQKHLNAESLLKTTKRYPTLRTHLNSIMRSSEFFLPVRFKVQKTGKWLFFPEVFYINFPDYIFDLLVRTLVKSRDKPPCIPTGTLGKDFDSFFQMLYLFFHYIFPVQRHQGHYSIRSVMLKKGLKKLSIFFKKKSQPSIFFPVPKSSSKNGSVSPPLVIRRFCSISLKPIITRVSFFSVHSYHCVSQCC